MTKRHYSYRITVTPTGAPDEGASLRPPFSFDATNHDDIIAIVERARANTGLGPDDAASVAVGLKLLGEVMLREKENPLFDPLRGGIRDFIGNLKALSRNKS
jgi:hypothetical protein